MSAPVMGLDDALTSGQAMFGGSPIVPATGKDGLRRLRSRLGDLFAAFPTVTTTGEGVQHSGVGGLYFASLLAGGGSYLAGLAGTSGPPIRPGQDIIAVTGRCLFGVGAITTEPGGGTLALLQQNNAIIEPDRRIDRIGVAAHPHIYETEGSARVGGFLQDLARVPGIGQIRVRAHFPVAEYQLHGLYLYRRGLMSDAAYYDYCTAISERGRKLAQALSAHLGPQVTLAAVSPLDWVHGVKTGNTDPGAALWAAAAKRPRHRLTGRLWRLLAAMRPDDSIEALSYASYSHAYLTAAIAAARRRQALILAEDPEEEPLFRRTWRYADAAGIPLRQRAAGFYLHPRLVALKIHPSSDGHYLYNVTGGCDPALSAGTLRGGSAVPSARL